MPKKYVYMIYSKNDYHGTTISYVPGDSLDEAITKFYETHDRYCDHIFNTVRYIRDNT